MKIRKRIAAFGAAMVMTMSVAAIGTSAREYCGGKTLDKSKIHNGTISEEVGTVRNSVGVDLADYGGAYNSNGVKAWCSYCTYTHYARVGSGGKYKESKKSSGIAVETSYVKMKNNKARLEGWVIA